MSIEITLDTPIYHLTPRQLFDMQKEYMAMQEKEEKPKPEQTPRYINNVEELAKVLGTSKSTIWKMKSEGLLDGAYSQHGKWIVFDTEKIIEKFRVTNKSKRHW